MAAIGISVHPSSSTSNNVVTQTLREESSLASPSDASFNSTSHSQQEDSNGRWTRRYNNNNHVQSLPNAPAPAQLKPRRGQNHSNQQQQQQHHHHHHHHNARSNSLDHTTPATTDASPKSSTVRKPAPLLLNDNDDPILPLQRSESSTLSNAQHLSHTNLPSVHGRSLTRPIMPVPPKATRSASHIPLSTTSYTPSHPHPLLQIASSTHGSLLQTPALTRPAHEWGATEVESIMGPLLDYYSVQVVNANTPLSSDLKTLLQSEGCPLCLQSDAFGPAVTIEPISQPPPRTSTQPIIESMMNSNPNSASNSPSSRGKPPLRSARSSKFSFTSSSPYVILTCRILQCKHILHVGCLARLHRFLVCQASIGGNIPSLPSLDLHHSTVSFRQIPMTAYEVAPLSLHDEGSSIPSGLLPLGNVYIQPPVDATGTRRCSIEVGVTHCISNAQALHMAWPMSMQTYARAKYGQEYLLLALTAKCATKNDNSNTGDNDSVQINPAHSLNMPSILAAGSANPVPDPILTEDHARFSITKGKIHLKITDLNTQAVMQHSANFDLSSLVNNSSSIDYDFTENDTDSIASADGVESDRPVAVKLLLADETSHNLCTIVITRADKEDSNNAVFQISYIMYDFMPVLIRPAVAPPIQFSSEPLSSLDAAAMSIPPLSLTPFLLSPVHYPYYHPASPSVGAGNPNVTISSIPQGLMSPTHPASINNVAVASSPQSFTHNKFSLAAAPSPHYAPLLPRDLIPGLLPSTPLTPSGSFMYLSRQTSAVSPMANPMMASLHSIPHSSIEDAFSTAFANASSLPSGLMPYGTVLSGINQNYGGMPSNVYGSMNRNGPNPMYGGPYSHMPSDQYSYPQHSHESMGSSVFSPPMQPHRMQQLDSMPNAQPQMSHNQMGNSPEHWNPNNYSNNNAINHPSHNYNQNNNHQNNNNNTHNNMNNNPHPQSHQQPQNSQQYLVKELTPDRSERRSNSTQSEHRRLSRQDAQQIEPLHHPRVDNNNNKNDSTNSNRQTPAVTTDTTPNNTSPHILSAPHKNHGRERAYSPALSAIHDGNSPLPSDSLALGPAADLHTSPDASLTSPPVLSPGSTTLESMVGNVVKLAKTHAGSRLMQQKLEERDQAFVDLFFDEMKEAVPALMVDNFGHFAIEKLIAVCSEEQILILLQKLAPTFCLVACQKHGSFSVQALVDSVNTPEQIDALMRAMKGQPTSQNNSIPKISPNTSINGILESIAPAALGENSLLYMITNPCGHFVILRVLQRFPPSTTSFIDQTICANCVPICTDHHGLRVVKALLAARNSDELVPLYNVIVRQLPKLVENQYGNYVVQACLDTAPAEVRGQLKSKMCGRLARLSKQKFSSNVVEKCLKSSSVAWRSKMIRELCESPAISELLRDRFANFVLQTAVTRANLEQLDELTRALTPHLHTLRDNVRTKWHDILTKARQSPNTYGDDLNPPSPLGNDDNDYSSDA